MYLLLKTVHVIAVVIFLGNITTGLFWKAHADRTGDPRLQAHAMAGIIRSDAWFTIPSVLMIIASGVALAAQAGLPLIATDWILAALVAFALSGLLFGTFLRPLPAPHPRGRGGGARRRRVAFGGLPPAVEDLGDHRAGRHRVAARRAGADGAQAHGPVVTVAALTPPPRCL